MILLINVCAEKLHYFEFVKPIENVLTNENILYSTKHYNDVHDEDLDKAEKVIICGTSIRDNKFLDDIDKFSWVKTFNKPVLGICAGMQIIGIVFGGGLKKHLEIGFFHEYFNKSFLGLFGEQEVYHLHKNYIDFSRLEEFEVFSGLKIVQAVKHRRKKMYGVLFHPEVRQKEMILDFVKKKK